MPGRDTLPDALGAMQDAEQFLAMLYCPENESNQDEKRYADKVRRALERLRRTAVKTLEATSGDGRKSSDATDSVHHSVQKLVESSVIILESVIQSVSFLSGLFSH